MLLTLITSFATCLILVPLCERLALKWGLVDVPGDRKIHTKPTPVSGGIAVFFGIAAGICINSGLLNDLAPLLLCGALIVLVGLLDALRLVHAQVKLLVVMPLVSVVLIFSGFGLKMFPWDFLNHFFTVVWVMGVAGAFNLIDGMDGLCSGLSLIASVFFLFWALEVKDPLITVTSISIAGSSLGFLLFNFYPARIFLGDGGAMLLGFLLSFLGLMLANSEKLNLLTRWMIPVLVLSVPIFDTTLISFSRLRKGVIPFLHPGRDHLHHRFLDIFRTQKKTVVFMYLLATIGGFLSILTGRANIRLAYTVFVTILFVCLFFILWLEKTAEEKARGHK
ncbi:MAG: MraY family glycosyltransferase [Candidatus Bathyarchaeia archaeon]|nr:undecaprenyl/decaprenyl-phosphate alpha-N-acetylglucosaminyl 1-phosphate transferase [Candidatus Jingweiarchaeum tengchongense]MCW1309103.1 undecaprenyl/decaprenyl-phosphate alpha-N-acetylglucosaminyl 1-phosphate transferase [Candidatus Jingweiarchaeum tengchongense]